MTVDAAWSFTIPSFTVTVPLAWIAAYFAVGALVVLPVDRVVWALWRRRGLRFTYREWVARKRPRYYPSGIVKWPAGVLGACRAARAVEAMQPRPVQIKRAVP